MEDSLSRRERKKLETRQSLLEAALDLFHEKGYDATTVEEITERADVAKGTFFNYFPSKEVLLSELALWRLKGLRARVDLAQGAPASPVARIRLLMCAMHEQAVQDVRVVQRALMPRIGYLPPPHPGREQLFALFTDLVLEAQTSGEIRADVDPELVSDLLRVLCFQCRRHFGHDSISPADHPDHILDLLMHGLAGPNWRHV